MTIFSSAIRKVTTVFTTAPWWNTKDELEAGDNDVGYVSPWYRKHESQWLDSRNLREGTEALRRVSERYVPRFENEVGDDAGDGRYQARLKGGVLFNGYDISLDGFVGLAFKKFPQLQDDVPTVVKEDHWERISVDGMRGPDFLRHCYDEAMGQGSGGCLVDYNAFPGDSSKTETAANSRPFWEWIAVERITNPDWIQLRGEKVLSLLTIRDERWERAPGSWRGRTVVFYRVFKLVPGLLPKDDVVEWERWRKDIENNKVTYVRTHSGIVGRQTRIPFEPLPLGKGRHPIYRAPVFWSLAEINMRHYLTDIAYHWNLHMQGYGIIVRIGAEPDDNDHLPPIYLGPGGIVDVAVGGDLKIVAPPADAFVHQRTALRDDETRMGSLGMSFLQPDLRMAETATAKELDASSQYSRSEMTIQTLVNFAEACLQFHANYIGEEDGGSILFPSDALSRGLDPNLLAALSLLEEKRQLPLRTLLQVIRDGKIPEDLNIDAVAAELVIERSNDAKKMMDLIKSKPAPTGGFGGKPPADAPPPKDAA